MVIDITSLAIGLGTGIIVGAAVAIVRSISTNKELEKKNVELKTKLEIETRIYQKTSEEMENKFKVMAAAALNQNNEQFITLATEKLKGSQKDASHNFEKREKAISEMVDPIRNSLKEMEGKIETLGKAGAGLEGQLKSFTEDQRILRQETRNLIEVLRNPATRGKWGEMQLERTLEMIGMVEGTHFSQQVSVNNDDGKRLQPDFIISMPGGMEIVIDVKTPIEPFWEAMEHARNDDEKSLLLKKFKGHIRNHLKELSSKEYWRQFDSPEFVVMFLPTEGIYSMAISSDKSLLEDAAKQNIILASPTTVMGLLRTVMHGWHQQKMADEAQNISTLAADLYKRICTFGDHMSKVGRGLGTAINAYNSAIGSLESQVLPGARKFKELQVQTGGKEIARMANIEHSARIITAPELTDKKTVNNK